MVRYFPKERFAISNGIMRTLDILIHKYPLNSPMKYSPFFIIGAGRSGTTLLRTMLNNHSEINIPPETFGFRNAFLKFKCFQFFSWDFITDAVLKNYDSGNEFFLWELDLSPAYEKGKKLENTERTFANLIHLIFQTYLDAKDPNAKIWGDKTPLNTYYLDWILKTFPNAKFINMVRDGRDVVSSLVKANLTNVINGCIRWNLAIEKTTNLKHTVAPQQFLDIQYEDLVESPENIIKNICHFLNISFQEKLLINNDKTSNMKDVKFYEHFKNLSNPINKKSIGKWKTNLSKYEQSLVKERLAKNLKLLGYQ